VHLWLWQQQESLVLIAIANFSLDGLDSGEDDLRRIPRRPLDLYNMLHLPVPSLSRSGRDLEGHTIFTCIHPASTSLYTATVCIPSLRAVLMIRQAISPLGSS
jgi:hypothetical protein